MEGRGQDLWERLFPGWPSMQSVIVPLMGQSHVAEEGSFLTLKSLGSLWPLWMVHRLQQALDEVAKASTVRSLWGNTKESAVAVLLGQILEPFIVESPIQSGSICEKQHKWA